VRLQVDIPPKIYAGLKYLARREQCSIQDLIIRLIEVGIEKNVKKFRIKLPIIKSQKPGSLFLNNAKIYRLIDFP
jgi:hypothetical protein